jgi:Acetyltransferases
MRHISVRPMQQGDIEAIVALSLRAWEPVYQSFKNVLGEAIYRHIFPEWRSHQANVVESMCRNSELYSGLVGEVDGVVGGFLLYELKRETRTGEIQLLAVDPNYQRLGLSLRLNSAALEIFRKEGMQLAFVSTGGDPGHAPARAAYEKAGFDRSLTIVQYYKWLGDDPQPES